MGYFKTICACLDAIARPPRHLLTNILYGIWARKLVLKEKETKDVAGAQKKAHYLIVLEES